MMHLNSWLYIVLEMHALCLYRVLTPQKMQPVSWQGVCINVWNTWMWKTISCDNQPVRNLEQLPSLLHLWASVNKALFLKLCFHLFFLPASARQLSGAFQHCLRMEINWINIVFFSPSIKCSLSLSDSFCFMSEQLQNKQLEGPCKLCYQLLRFVFVFLF